MKTERAPFAPLNSDVDDDRIEQLARDKGVGTYAASPPIQPQASPANPRGEGETRTSSQAAIPIPEIASVVARQATPRSRMKKVNLELPDYLWTELKIRAVQRQTSVRHVVMTALVADGLTIAEIDMVEDGRRDR